MAAHPCVLARLREAAPRRGSTVTAIAASRLGVACAFASRSQVPEVVVWVGSEPVAAGAGDLHAVTVVALGDRGGAPVCCFASRSGAASWDLRSDAVPVARFEEESAAPECGALDASGCVLAVGVGRRVELVRSDEPETLVARLEGHRGRVAAVAFEAGGGSGFASCGEDRTFKVWDLAQRACLYSSAVLCAAPLRALALERGRVAAAAGDGRVWLFERQEDSGFCAELLVLDLRKSLPATASPAPAAPPAPAVISSEPAWARPPDAPEAVPEASETSAGALALRFTESGLAVATPSHVLAVDVVSRGVAVVEALQKVASVAALSSDGSPVRVAAAGAFEAAVYAGTLPGAAARVPTAETALSFFAPPPRGGFPADSPLRADVAAPPPKDRTLLSYDTLH